MVEKKKTVRHRTAKMSLASEDRVRLAIDCTREERKYIKMYASFEDMTLNEFVMDCVRDRISHCQESHIPNAETAAALDASERGEGIIAFDSIDDFFKSMGA